MNIISHNMFCMWSQTSQMGDSNSLPITDVTIWCIEFVDAYYLELSKCEENNDGTKYWNISLLWMITYTDIV